jgi:hypothetical protein
MEFDNATNLDRKSGVREPIMICFHCFPDGLTTLNFESHPTDSSPIVPTQFA